MRTKTISSGSLKFCWSKRFVIPLQRIVALLMAGALVFIFLVPLALARHAYPVVAFVVGVFLLYVAVNAWIWMRMRS